MHFMEGPSGGAVCGGFQLPFFFFPEKLHISHNVDLARLNRRLVVQKSLHAANSIAFAPNDNHGTSPDMLPVSWKPQADAVFLS
jgi:hypothetical protein